jgi:hypothetical protein
MCEIVGDQIAALNDADLWALIGLLCEPEMCRDSFPATACQLLARSGQG